MSASIAGVGETRERIVEVAQKLLRTQSYLGFSFNDVANEVGVRKATLHHHFPSKEALGLELLAAATEGFRTWCQSAPESPAAALSAFVELYRSNLLAGQAVCPGGAFVPGWGCTSDTLQAAVRKLRADQIDWLTEVFKRDDKLPSAEARALAASVFAACQGALASARVTGKVKDFDAAMTLVRALCVETE